MSALFENALIDTENPWRLKYSIPYIVQFDDENKKVCPMELAMADKGSVKTAGMMLYFLKAQDFDHHSKQLANILPELISKDVANVTEYIDSRCC